MDRDTWLHLLDPPEGRKGYFCCSSGLQRLRYLYGEEYGLTADSEPEMVHA